MGQATQKELARGERLRGMLKQAQNAPIPVEEQVCVIYAGINGYLDDIAVDEVLGFLAKLRANLKSSFPQLLETIKSEKKLSSESEELFKKVLIELREKVSLTTN